MLSLALAVTMLPLASAIGADATVSQYSAQCYGPGADSDDLSVWSGAHASADCTDVAASYDTNAVSLLCGSVDVLRLLPGGSQSAVSELRTTSDCGVETAVRVY